VALGNHETAVRKVHSSDLVAQFHRTFKGLYPNSPVMLGGYTGQLDFYHPTKKKNFRVFHWHGAGGGGAPALVGQFDKKATWVEGVDVMWFGHLHGLGISADLRYDAPTGAYKQRWLVRTPSYLDAYATRSYGSEALYNPRPTGCVFLDLDWATGTSQVRCHSALL
jgi:hypothetical protein